MYGLKVTDGDLVLQGLNYQTVEGTPKIAQDLSFALLERVGSDPYHPFWGSILSRFIGEPLTDEIRQRVVVAIRTVLTNYVAVQRDQITKAGVDGTRSTLNSSQVVQSVNAIDVQTIQDRLTVRIELTTLSGDILSLQRQVS